MPLTPIRTPLGYLMNRAAIGERLRDAWPHQPAFLHTILVHMLSDRRLSIDALLTVADALKEAADVARLDGHLAVSAGATRLWDLVLEAADNWEPHPAERAVPRGGAA